MARCIYQTIPTEPFTVKVMSPNQYGEFVVRVQERKYDGAWGNQGHSYYTNDRDDAINTANDIALRLAR